MSMCDSFSNFIKKQKDLLKENSFEHHNFCFGAQNKSH